MTVRARRSGTGRRTTAVVLVTLLGVLAAACSDSEPRAGGTPGEEPREPVGEPQHGGTITVGLEADFSSVLPHERAHSTSSLHVAHAVFDPLVERSADGELQPNLAESFEGSPDLRSWTFRLRSGVRFHDGTPLDAETVKAAFDEYLNAEGSILAGQLVNVTEVEVVDPLTVRYLLSEPDATFPALMSQAAGMPFSVEAVRAGGEDAATRTVGTGPFRVADWRPGERIDLERNVDYWRDDLPYLDGITFRPIPDEDLRAQSLLTGGVDAMHTARGSTIKQVLPAEDEGYTVQVTVGDDAAVVLLNSARPPFDDVRIRRAFAHLIDPEEVAALLGDDGLVEGATQFFGPESPWYSERVAASVTGFDLDAAAREVQSYVQDPDRSDGAAIGQEPTVDFTCLDDASLVEVTTFAQIRGREIGLNVQPRIVTEGELITIISGDETTEPPFVGDYDVGCYRLPLTGDPASTFASFFAPEGVPSNLTNFRDSEIDRLVHELRDTAVFEEQYDLVEQIGLRINEQVPLGFATATPTAIVVAEGIHNLDGWTLPDGKPGSDSVQTVARWREVWRESQSSSTP